MEFCRFEVTCTTNLESLSKIISVLRKSDWAHVDLSNNRVCVCVQVFEIVINMQKCALMFGQCVVYFEVTFVYNATFHTYNGSFWLPSKLYVE